MYNNFKINSNIMVSIGSFLTKECVLRDYIGLQEFQFSAVDTYKAAPFLVKILVIFRIS